jgi:hypothetical protein
MTVKTLAQGFGAAMVVLILRVWPQLSRYHPVIYHSFLPMQSVVWGVFIDLIVVSLLGALLFSYLEKKETVLRNVLWALVAAELSACAVTALDGMHRGEIPHLTPNGAFYAVLLGSLLLLWIAPESYRFAVRGLGVVLLLAGFSLVWMVPQLLYQALRTQRADVAVPVTYPMQAGEGSSTERGRLVWLIFDELSYDQLFEHRFPGLAMPAFDDFKTKSVVFTNLKQVGYYTDRVIPSFLLGKQIVNLKSNLDGVPSVILNGQPSWQGIDPKATLFADAQRLGWSTGVAGWYNPYCRILTGVLNYCFWRMGDGQSDGALPDHSAWQNALAPLVQRSRDLRHEPSLAAEKHREDLAAIMPRAEALLRDDSIAFAFIHLPVPHPPGIYHRHPARPGEKGSYIDNLALADKTLGELMQTLNATASGSKATVIVCSDHSWRVAMWRNTSIWTQEDEAASHGRFDPRPVLMIHSPGQQTEQQVTAPFDELRLHDIIEQILHGGTFAASIFTPVSEKTEPVP